MFMGDVGSTFLGFSFAGLSLLANIGVGGDRLPIEFGLVLFAPFLFDSLVTLSRRVVRGERWYAAHRSHYYQRLVRCGLSHGQVTGLYAGLAVVAAGAASGGAVCLGAAARATGAGGLCADARGGGARVAAGARPPATEARVDRCHSGTELTE